ncbi:MAG TPA: tetratricopeptide repeat protein [Acidobacteriaceae bacterium]|nr:tetratricopeptide repeat protein [Acidobacteriaceae bacterium]
MRKTKIWLASLLAALLIVAAAPSLLAQNTAKVHGHVNDPLDVPLVGVQVKLSTDGTTAKYIFTTDENGDYKGAGIAPGTYYFTLFNKKGQPVDQATNIIVAAGADKEQNFDLSRPDYIAKMNPEEKKAYEAAKKANESISKENAKIKNLNADLKTAREDNNNKNYAAAEELMTRDTALKPDASVLWVELGRAQKGLKKYPDAATSFQKAISVDAATKKPNLDIEAAADNSLGEILADIGKVDQAQAAYDAAVKADPKNAAMYYGNEAIMMDRLGKIDATVAAADKAIAANPNSPIPYYLKGKALINHATVDKAGKIVAPPGCAEAYQKYIELAPNGPFANDAKAILAQLGTKVQSKYHHK